MMKNIVKTSVIVAYLAGVLLLLCACNDNLDVKQQYAFSVETMPFPSQLSKGETMEIRCLLKEGGNFLDNEYTIRYFQFEGEGSLRLGENGQAFMPNDRYPLSEKVFRLYYTSDSEESQVFTVYFENSFGKVQTLEVEVDNVNEKEEV